MCRQITADYANPMPSLIFFIVESSFYVFKMIFTGDLLVAFWLPTEGNVFAINAISISVTHRRHMSKQQCSSWSSKESNSMNELTFRNK